MTSYHRALTWLLAPLFGLTACSDDSAPNGGQGGAAGARPTTFGGDRPAELHVPEGHDPTSPSPLLVMLHGRTASGLVQEIYLQLAGPAADRGMLYIHPDGTPDQNGERFWNATDACCDFYDAGVDDSSYLKELVDEIRQHYAVDERQIYFFGHSNGGFMSYRMACDHADMVAAIGSLAGATYLDPTRCSPTEPVHVLEIHGTEDGDVLYEGGTNHEGGEYPGAIATVEQWATYDGCQLSADTSPPPLDLEGDIAGAETTVRRYETGCDPGGSAALWTIAGGGHLPSLSDDFVPNVLDFLLAHAKP